MNRLMTGDDAFACPLINYLFNIHPEKRLNALFMFTSHVCKCKVDVLSWFLKVFLLVVKSVCMLKDVSQFYQGTISGRWQ